MSAKRRSRIGNETPPGRPGHATRSSSPDPVADVREAPPRCGWGITVACLALLVLAVLAAFAPARHNEFLYWDDDNNLMFNAHIRDFSWENVKWMWSAPLLGVWQPLTWMLTAVEYRLCDGADLARFSRGMHLASIGLQAVAAMLVYVLARRLIAVGAPVAAHQDPVGLSLGALIGALFFAVHPLRVETTAWASGQAYILAIIPALAAVWCYLGAQQTAQRRWHVGAIVCLTASLLCKAMAVPLVAALLVLDVYPLKRLGGAAGWRWPQVRRILLEKLPYAAVTVVTASLTVWATWATKNYAPDPPIAKFLISAYCMLFYVGMTFVPYHPAPYYMKPTPFDSGDPWFLGAAGLFVLVTVLLIRFRRRAPWLLAAWACHVLIVLPNAGLVKHGGQLAADRYSYLSCIGWAVLLGAGMFRLWQANRHRMTTLRRAIGIAAASAVLTGLALASRSYCRDWRDSETVWSAMVARNPLFGMGYYNLAKACKRPCDDLLRRAAEAERASDTENAAALRAEATQRYRTAEAHYRAAIATNPLYAEANVDLGNMIRQGHAPGGLDEAIRCYETALRGRPDFHMAHLNLATVMMDQGRYAEAVEHLEAAEADAKRSGEAKRLATIQQTLAAARAHLNPR